MKNRVVVASTARICCKNELNIKPLIRLMLHLIIINVHSAVSFHAFSFSYYT